MFVRNDTTTSDCIEAAYILPTNHIGAVRHSNVCEVTPTINKDEIPRQEENTTLAQVVQRIRCTYPQWESLLHISEHDWLHLWRSK